MLTARGIYQVRKTAQTAVLHIVSHPPPPTAHHPASVSLARFLTHTLRESNDETLILHILPLIKSVLPYLRPAQLEHVAATVLALRSFCNPHVIVGVFEAMESLFSYLLDNDNVSNIAVEKLAKLNANILDMKPNVNDAQLLPLWLSMVVNGMICRTRIDPLGASQQLPKVYEIIFHLLQLTPHTKSLTKAVHQSIRESLHSLAEFCITDEIITKSLISLKQTSRSAPTPLEIIISKTESGLALAYQSGWAVVLDAIRFLLERTHDGPAEGAFQLLASPLQQLTDDKLFAQNEHYPHHGKLQELLGTAIRVLGPRQFLTIFPLNEEGDECRTWLFPLFQENVCNTELAFFLNYFIPLSQRIAKRGQTLVMNGNAVKGKTFAVVWRQIWDLLPAFCHAPVDLKEVRFVVWIRLLVLTPVKRPLRSAAKSSSPCWPPTTIAFRPSANRCDSL